MARRRRKKNTGFKFFMLLLIAVCLVVLGRQEYRIYQVHKEQTATQARIDKLKQEKAALEKERRLLDDPAYIEKLAREDYNMVGKNEVSLFIVDDKK